MLSGFSNLPNDVDTVVALCRPPGHHCDGRRAGGYCYINNAALAVSVWRSTHPDALVDILDIDFHHGNGTQEIFYADPKVLYVSIHGEDEFVSSSLPSLSVAVEPHPLHSNAVPSVTFTHTIDCRVFAMLGHLLTLDSHTIQAQQKKQASARLRAPTSTFLSKSAVQSKNTWRTLALDSGN